MNNVFASATKDAAAVLSDTTPQEFAFKSIHCNSDGVVYISRDGGATSTKYAAVTGGSINASGTHVMTAGTTATDLTIMTW